ncbi:hypothetical protein [Pseudocitrobacter faecalis]|uniref:hypothetical protein n=1 Tax=Pseudocitrobacter faecalis TaxID=1398493 RepID=UPI003314B046
MWIALPGDNDTRDTGDHDISLAIKKGKGKKTKKTRRGMPGVKKGINKFNEGYSNRQWVKLAGYNFWQLNLSVIYR